MTGWSKPYAFLSSLRRIIALVRKEFLALLRDPKSRFVVIGMPLLQFFVFAYAATFDVTHVRYAVLDESRTTESRELLARIEGSPSFRLVERLESAGQIPELIDTQRARLLLHVRSDSAECLAAGEPAELQVIADGRNSNVSSVATSYVSDIVAAYHVRRAADLGLPPPPIEVIARDSFNSTLRSRWTIVSGLAATIAMVVVMLLSSLLVAREREFGTFDQLLVAPFHQAEILTGKAVPGASLGSSTASCSRLPQCTGSTRPSAAPYPPCW